MHSYFRDFLFVKRKNKNINSKDNLENFKRTAARVTGILKALQDATHPNIFPKHMREQLKTLIGDRVSVTDGYLEKYVTDKLSFSEAK